MVKPQTSVLHVPDIVPERVQMSSMCELTLKSQRIVHLVSNTSDKAFSRDFDPADGTKTQLALFVVLLDVNAASGRSHSLRRERVIQFHNRAVNQHAVRPKRILDDK